MDKKGNKGLNRARAKYLQALNKVEEFWAAHPKLKTQIKKLEAEYSKVLDSYKKTLRDYLLLSDLQNYVDEDTGIKVVYVKPATVVDTEGLVKKLGWAVASKYMNRYVSYSLVDDTALERMVASGHITLKELNEFIEEKERAPRVTVPSSKKSVL